MSFTTKENSALGYFFYLTELDPDPHFFGSWIRIHIQKKLLDPDSQKKMRIHSPAKYRYVKS